MSSAEQHARIRAHLDRGAPWDACDAFRESAAEGGDDPEWLFAGALAHARAGAEHEAHALLDRATRAAETAPMALRVDILALRGRLWKDASLRAPSARDADAHAARARAEYLAAYALNRDPFPGINAATLSIVLGEREQAHALAREVETTLVQRGEGLTGWDLLTGAEAALLLGDDARARERYVAASRESGRDHGRIASARRQLRLLSRVLPSAVDMLAVLRAPDVIAFTGHMIDAPGRAPSRFPPSLEPAVAKAIRERARAWHEPVLFASAACGADLLMLEAAIAAGAEVNVVLPFPADEFIRTSVAPAGASWAARFDAAVSRASRVVFATNEGYLGDDVLFEHCARLVDGLAMLRARQLETSAKLLAVLDAHTPERTGGTRSTVERWQRNGGEIDIIDLGALQHTPPRSVSPRTDAIAAPPSRDGHGRALKSMLFADVAGYSRLDDAEVPRFQRIFWAVAARELDRSALLGNTWGDAVFAVFDTANDAASFAMRLRDRMRVTDWAAAGISQPTSLRIALHCAPVFSGHDPILGRTNYFGAGVTRAARIEPVTPPGLIYASEAFAATLAASGSSCSLEYVGTLDLAKHYGESRVYRLEDG